MSKMRISEAIGILADGDPRMIVKLVSGCPLLRGWAIKQTVADAAMLRHLEGSCLR